MKHLKISAGSVKYGGENLSNRTYSWAGGAVLYSDEIWRAFKHLDDAEGALEPVTSHYLARQSAPLPVFFRCPLTDALLTWCLGGEGGKGVNRGA